MPNNIFLSQQTRRVLAGLGLSSAVTSVQGAIFRYGDTDGNSYQIESDRLTASMLELLEDMTNFCSGLTNHFNSSALQLRYEFQNLNLTSNVLGLLNGIENCLVDHIRNVDNDENRLNESLVLTFFGVTSCLIIASLVLFFIVHARRGLSHQPDENILNTLQKNNQLSKRLDKIKNFNADLIPDEYCCPISTTIMQEPVAVVENGHHYYFENACIRELFKLHDPMELARNPLTRGEFRERDLQPAPALALAIETFVRKQECKNSLEKRLTLANIKFDSKMIERYRKYVCNLSGALMVEPIAIKQDDQTIYYEKSIIENYLNNLESKNIEPAFSKHSLLIGKKTFRVANALQQEIREFVKTIEQLNDTSMTFSPVATLYYQQANQLEIEHDQKTFAATRLV